MHTAGTNNGTDCLHKFTLGRFLPVNMLIIHKEIICGLAAFQSSLTYDDPKRRLDEITIPVEFRISRLLPMQPGAVLALARWWQWGATIPAGGRGAQYAAELRMLLVYLSESLGRLVQNGGPLGGHIFHWGPRPLCPPP